MSEDSEVGTQPADSQASDFPGAGRGRDEVPGNAPFEKVKEKFQEIADEDTGEGRMSLRVIDEQGNEKERVETRRVKGPGSVEVRAFEENGKQKWGLKRKDKLGHTNKDKLNNDGGDS